MCYYYRFWIEHCTPSHRVYFEQFLQRYFQKCNAFVHADLHHLLGLFSHGFYAENFQPPNQFKNDELMGKKSTNQYALGARNGAFQ